MLEPLPPDRLLTSRRHDDGVNAWTMRRVAPPPQLAGLIDDYVDYAERTAGFTTRRELPHPGGVMIFNLGDPIWLTGGDGNEIKVSSGESFVGGAHLRPAFSRSSGAQAGIQISLPLESIRQLLAVPMGELTDRVVPLDDLLYGMAEALLACRGMAERVATLDVALSRHQSLASLDRRQAHALRLIRQRPDLDLMAIADLVGWSRKHLSSRMHDAIGVGPRTYRRLLRFQRLTGSLVPGTPVDWADRALGAGYFDQSHMIREFREFAGMTPTEFVSRSLADGGGLVEA